VSSQLEAGAAQPGPLKVPTGPAWTQLFISCIARPGPAWQGTLTSEPGVARLLSAGWFTT